MFQSRHRTLFLSLHFIGRRSSLIFEDTVHHEVSLDCSSRHRLGFKFEKKLVD